MKDIDVRDVYLLIQPGKYKFDNESTVYVKVGYDFASTALTPYTEIRAITVDFEKEKLSGEYIYKISLYRDKLFHTFTVDRHTDVSRSSNMWLEKLDCKTYLLVLGSKESNISPVLTSRPAIISNYNNVPFDLRVGFRDSIELSDVVEAKFFIRLSTSVLYPFELDLYADYRSDYRLNSMLRFLIDDHYFKIVCYEYYSFFQYFSSSLDGNFNRVVVDLEECLQCTRDNPVVSWPRTIEECKDNRIVLREPL